MLPSILAKRLQKGIADYIETTFPMTNEPFKGSVQNLLATNNSVYREPYIAARLPFRVASEKPTCFQALHPEYLPYTHQQKAFERLTGEDPKSTLVATGTGSGKTECFLYPILEYCYRRRGERGIKALIIYPMNALASDQAKRIAELIYDSPELRGNVTVGMYVGGFDKTPSRMMTEHGVITDRETMLNCPPDILLTNYKMLDYLLVRPKDAELWRDNDPKTLKYIAVDELHTFDGAQGTDLACLLRRLKRRLGIDDGYLCCVGTSATIGGEENNAAVRDYASEVFGEPFDDDSVITEDRLTAAEFFENSPTTRYETPSSEDVDELNRLSESDDPSGYLKKATASWFPDFTFDVMSDEGRIELGKALMTHDFMREVVRRVGGKYCQASGIADELSSRYPQLRKISDPVALIDSLFALVSHARTGKPGNLRPFLFVQAQLWMRELRRLLAKVDSNDIDYRIASELNDQQKKEYLPVVNCRDCGATGWASIQNERHCAVMTNLEAFYNRYFRADDKIVMMFPFKRVEEKDKKEIVGTSPARLCPSCLQVDSANEGNGQCRRCGEATIDVLIPNPLQTTSRDVKQYVCPCCGSRRGLSLIGLRGASEISASLSQMFASKFNEDKKTLAFSDSVQDAAHKAGFFNSRTWRFGLRTAIQKYCAEFGSGKSLAEFQEGFVQYWRDRMNDEKFVSFFIAPNMTWRKAYEDMIEKRKFGDDKYARDLMTEIEKRLKYEIMLEYGVAGKIGRTLEKSGCSVISFDPEDVVAIAETVQERTVNELGDITSETIEDYERMTAGYLNLMRQNGAFVDPVFDAYATNAFNGYLLSADYNRWLPGRQSGRNTPRFVVEQVGAGKRSTDYDAPDGKKYRDWIASCDKTFFSAPSNYINIVCKFILDAALKRGVVALAPSSPNFKVYGLNKSRVYVSDDVVQTRCSTCGSFYAVSAENARFWKGAPCLRSNCKGTLEEVEDVALGYYGKLYNAGDLERVNAKEHTGLLERRDREELEIDFKGKENAPAPWDPNVLSCTPTLEMGIDIGDLSTVVLCSMPPSQSQFLQRTGRAGRKDGNSLTLVVANARPHDLYFYSEPTDMISGEVTPPKIFLRAPAVLERQFTAFCLDSWVKSGIPEGAIPERVGAALDKLNSPQDNAFPRNFLTYAQSYLSQLLDSFFRMFDRSWGDQEEIAAIHKELEAFALEKSTTERSMSVVIFDAFGSLWKQRESLRKNYGELSTMIKELKAKPKDSSYDDEIKELKAEQKALLNVVHELNRKNVFNFLSDEGLLPNYAFPEPGVVLKAILIRKENEEQSSPAPAIKKLKYEKMVYEYNRSASAAISEFAPNNTFYVAGRKLTIDQVDLTTAEPAKWRLCPNCSHIELYDSAEHAAACPRCGSPEWADAGQIKMMLKATMVYSNADYAKSLVGDESDDRSTVFYCKQLLVDVDEDRDVVKACRMNNKDFPFGYEFVKKAFLREINFGVSDSVGEKMRVSGVEEVRRGFKVCRYCGKIQQDGRKPNHSYLCNARNATSIMSPDAYEECLFLYREFNTEILRLLIPATTIDSSTVKTESFVAAFMLGMKEYFGNVDHLRATVCEIPVPDAAFRKQYLVIYDSVPGGTGYLKQLMRENNSLIEIFEKALRVMEECSCKDDPLKDGCYRCLYAYRQSRHIGAISRTAAISILKSILSGKDNLEHIDRLGSIPINPLFDSELETRFMEAVRRKAGTANVSDSFRDGKRCYFVKFNELSWEIEPQVDLDAEQGVKVKCRPDFVFWPVSAPNHLPVAVFTDGFTYHKDRVADDTLKREAIRRSGKFRVWSLSFKDVQNCFTTQEKYATNTLDSDSMPYGKEGKSGRSGSGKYKRL